MPPDRSPCSRGERRGPAGDGGTKEETRGRVQSRRRRRCPCRLAQLVAAGVAVVVASNSGVDASALAKNATCGAGVDADVWTTRGCERSCGRSAVVCAYRTRGDCNSAAGSEEHFCLAYPGKGGETCRVECLAVDTAGGDEEWTVRLSQGEAEGAGAVIGPLEPPATVSTLLFVADERWSGEEAAPVAVEFATGLEDAVSITSMVFAGLDLTAAGFPSLPPTLTHLQLEDCVLAAFPADLSHQVPALESLELHGNRLASDKEEALLSITEDELLFLSLRLRGSQHLVLDAADDAKCASGRSAAIGDFTLCLDSSSHPLSDDDITSVARRLASSSGSSQSESSSSSSSGSGSGEATTIWPTSKYVIVSLGAPFLYFLYKLGLFFYFLKTYPSHESEHDGAVVTSMTAVTTPPHTTKHGEHLDDDSDTQRPTLEGSSGSLSRSPAPIALVVKTPATATSTLRAEANPRAQQQQLASANFWVDEELQSWRLDFRLFAMQRCLTLSASQKRQTLRKASVTSALHPREIWLASYTAEGAETSTPDRQQLVALKFVPPTMSNIGGGGPSKDAGGSQDKLRAELRRQAQLSHPNVAAFIGVAWSPQTHLVAVTEYLEQGDLRQWLHRTRQPTEATDGQVFGPGVWGVVKLQMLVDLTRALVYLHSMHPPVAHGNCNSRNVLLARELRAKWSDFGNAAGEALSERDRLAYSAVGSGRWISPEALLGRETISTPRGPRGAGDVYSLGVLMAEVDSHALPFSDLMRANRSALPETDILQLIAQGALSPTLSETCAPVVVELVAACTQYAPAQRPSSKQVLARLQRALQEAKDAAARLKAARMAAPAVGQLAEAHPAGGAGGEQGNYYAGDEGKVAPRFV